MTPLSLGTPVARRAVVGRGVGADAPQAMVRRARGGAGSGDAGGVGRARSLAPPSPPLSQRLEEAGSPVDSNDTGEQAAMPDFPDVAPVDNEATGWGAIGAISVVKCAYCRFVLRGNVGQWRVEFANVVADVLELVASTDSTTRVRGLKWWLILP